MDNFLLNVRRKVEIFMDISQGKHAIQLTLNLITLCNLKLSLFGFSVVLLYFHYVVLTNV